MNDGIINSTELITKLFSNIDASKITSGNVVEDAWNKTVEKIYNYGPKLVGHTKVVDLKNGILLVETDHPGWNQILQSNKSFIMKGLKLHAKDVDIKTIAYKVKGTDAHLVDDYKTSLEKAKKESLEKMEAEEKKLEEMGFKNDVGQQEIPEEVKNLFKGILN